MNRVHNRIPIGAGKTRHVLLLTDSYPCVVGDAYAMNRLCAIFTEFSTSPHLLSMAGNQPKTLKFFHNGTSWAVEAETIVDQE